ncbi:DUF2807 domain-containing protein [Hymenobacter sp. BT683]|uniref:DUF2807 domain-containing protein n=1 Tax=Hymenobacter jeongseonensis TaxID=2791027 RepID=A0ABS0ID29_9BACT|nr:head GIN domain-containing protein [Hymenobacter jeongseonensis]MBF9236067.1 DUF2807 domain-containing protein [Hymenobacter jeongseonensis]
MKNLTSLALLWLLALVPALAQTASETRSLPSFQAVEVSSGVELHLVSGQPQAVQASADSPELLARLTTEVSNGVLKISFDRKLSEAWGKKNFVRNLRVNVTAASLTALKASSGSKVEVAGTYATDNLDLGVSSGATLQATFAATSLNARVSSGGVATVTGKIQRLDVQASSGGVFKGSDLQATACEAAASSGGTVAVAVQESLTANASSGGDVRYSGSPKVTKRTSSGGSVKSR